jgi:thiamine kinase-like enzyme
MIDPDLAAQLGRIPLFLVELPSRVVRLGGLTNVNHLVEHPSGRYVLRVPGAGTAEYIDRRAEAIAARAAADCGVNADVVFFDPDDGLMLTRFVDGVVTMDAARFATDPGAVRRAGEVLRRLHSTSAPFATDFGLFSMIDDYKALLTSKRAALPDGYDDVHEQADELRAALEANPTPLVACHCDPLCENFLDTGEQMYLIDYEYAGNNDPMWDLGDLSVEGGFTPAQDRALLRAYFGGDPPADQVGRMVAYKALCDLLWSLWGVIQHANDNPADDFWAYAVNRFERCRALMSSPDFAAQIAAIGA